MTAEEPGHQALSEVEVGPLTSRDNNAMAPSLRLGRSLKGLCCCQIQALGEEGCATLGRAIPVRSSGKEAPGDGKERLTGAGDESRTE